MSKNIILDTDIGCDCDDVLALAYALKAHNMGLCKLLGVTYCSILPNVPNFIRLIIGQYIALQCGQDDIPIGVIKNYDKDYYKLNKDNYAGEVLAKFPIDNIADYEDAVRLLRRLLVSAAGKVTIAAVGPLPNLAQLLKSQPDDISPLNGIDLVRTKVDEFACMIGDFRTGDAKHAEWNVIMDIESCQYVMDMSPVPVILLPYETGLDMITGAKMVERDGDTTPTSYSYMVHGSSGGRHSWDPATVLYTVKGAEPWFNLSPAGVIKVDNDGFTNYTEKSDGLHYYLTCAMIKAEIAAEIDGMV
jgi:Inosine-uridine nucleoside N-ribohydrolase